MQPNAQWRQSSLGEGETEGGPPRLTHYRGGGKPDCNYFLWLDLERTLDKRRWKVGMVRRRQLKKVITLCRGDD